MEAIYYFCLDYHELFLDSQYNGEYDNLLFYFKFMYGTIKALYDGGKYIKAYTEHGGRKRKSKREKQQEKMTAASSDL